MGTRSNDQNIDGQPEGTPDVSGHEAVVARFGGSPKMGDLLRQREASDAERHIAGANFGRFLQQRSVGARSERAGHTDTVVASPRKPVKIDQKLHFGDDLAYPETMDAKEFNKLVSSLTEEKKQKLFRIVTDFVEAADDGNVVPLLIKVPKSTLESGAGMVRIPIAELPDSFAKEKRREVWAAESRERRKKMSPEELAEHRRNDAERKRAKRQTSRTPE